MYGGKTMTLKDFCIIAGVAVIVFLVLLYSIMSMSSECSRREENEAFDKFKMDNAEEG